MEYIPYPDIDTAHTRSREWWTAILGRAKNAEDITEFVYARRQRTGDPEADAGLPAGVDAAIVVAERDDWLDGLLRADEITQEEMVRLINLYPAWSGDGVDYEVGDLVRYNSQLWECISGHLSQLDWQPDVAVSLWKAATPDGVIPEWIQPTGAHDAYALGDLVTHNGDVWESLIDANVWEPGSTGAEDLWEVIA